jgi:hypothetical protein
LGSNPLNDTPSRLCTKCGEEKYIHDFPKKKGRLHGVGSHCKACVNAKQKRIYHTDLNDLTQRLWRLAKERAKKKKLPFTITPADIVIPERCPVLGLPLKQATDHTKDCSATVDRLVPELGYVQGNINVVSSRANLIKSCGNAEEHRQVAAWIEAETLKLKGGQ